MWRASYLPRTTSRPRHPRSLALRRRQRRGEGRGVHPRRRRRARHRARVPALRVHADDLGDERRIADERREDEHMPDAYVDDEARAAEAKGCPVGS